MTQSRRRRSLLALLPSTLGLGCAAALLAPSQAVAGPVYSCTAGTACDGNAYALYVKSHVGDTYQLEFDIDVLSTYTGNQWSDVVETVEAKDFLSAGTFSNLSLVSAPGGVGDWTLSPDELNANGCTGGAHVGTNICAGAIGGSYPGAPLIGPGQILSWVFQFDTTSTLASTGHIKYEYEDSSGNKVGSLGSWDIGIQPPPSSVPEPGTLILFGSALAGLAALRLRRRRG